MRSTVVALLTAAILGFAGPAAAYVGPGAGLSLVGAFWGLMIAVLAALSFVVLWPVRRLLRRQRVHASAETPETDPAASRSRLG